MARGNLRLPPWGCNHALTRRKCYTNTGPIRKTLVWEQEILVRFQIMPGTSYGPLYRVPFQPSTFVVWAWGMQALVNEFPDSKFVTWNLRGSLALGWVTSDPRCCGTGLIYTGFFGVSFLSIFFHSPKCANLDNNCSYSALNKCLFLVCRLDPMQTRPNSGRPVRHLRTLCFPIKLLGILVGVKGVKFLVHLTWCLPWALNLKCLEVEDEKQFCLGFLALNKRYCII